MKLFTAVASVGTAMALVPITPIALSMKFPEELEKEIEERKKAERALQELNATLEAQVEERTKLAEERARHLEVLKEEAEHANLVKSEFLAMMSHELRTPLNGVGGMLELLESTPLNEKQTDYLQTAKGCSEALLNLIDDILDLTRIEAGKFTVTELPFQPSSLVGLVNDVFEVKYEQTAERLVPKIEPSIPEFVLGDKGRVLQILNNLVGNAFKYGEGEVRLEMGYENGELLFKIQDQGPGIPEDFQAHLFDPFTQAENVTQRRFEGAGLGLAIVSRLVKLMNGDLQFKSVSGVGTTFEVRIPAPVTEKPEEKTPNVASSFENLRILLVEDNPINRKVVGLQLEKAGVQDFLTAPDGENALALLEQHEVDIMVLDCQMPGLSGFEVAERVRAKPERYGKPIIIALTAHAFPQEKEKCLAVGMNDFLSKPIPFERLRDALGKWAELLRNGESG